MALKEDEITVRKRIIHDTMDETSPSKRLIDDSRRNTQRTLDELPMSKLNYRKWVGYWFLASALMILTTISIAGVGRMTEAGLNLVDFGKFRGEFPPLTSSGWKNEFAKYTKRPDFWMNSTEATNPNQNYSIRVMNLAEFEVVWIAEFLFKYLLYLTPVMILGPAAYFWASNALSLRQKQLVLVAGSLILIMGVAGLVMRSIGMDPCGSNDQAFPSTKHYRLSFFLITGVSLYATLLWGALSSLLESQTLVITEKLRRLRIFAYFTLGALMFTFMYGTLVAGTDAGLIYNNWPFYGGTKLFFPPVFFELSPWYRNFYDSRPTIQWFHRHAAYFSAFCVFMLWLYGMTVHNLTFRAKLVLHALVAAMGMQAILGILNLWFRTPALLAILHQNTNGLVQTAALWFCNELRGVPY